MNRKKDFNLPAFFVDIGNGLSREPEMVGQKNQALAGLRVFENDSTQRIRAFLGLRTRETDGLV